MAPPRLPQVLAPEEPHKRGNLWIHLCLSLLCDFPSIASVALGVCFWAVGLPKKENMGLIVFNGACGTRCGQGRLGGGLDQRPDSGLDDNLGLGYDVGLELRFAADREETEGRQGYNFSTAVRFTTPPLLCGQHGCGGCWILQRQRLFCSQRC